MLDHENLPGVSAYLAKNVTIGAQKLDDIYSLGLLQPLLQDYPFLPITGASLRPYCLVHILNDIIVNRRKSIIEFGSGVSTILIGRLLKKNRLEARLISVEHNEEWCGVLQEQLTREGLGDRAEVIHAPLTDSVLGLDGNEWYDRDLLSRRLDDRRFDMVIVDGPPAWQQGREKARYPALPFILDRLLPHYSLYLDDANRSGEQSIIELWKNEYGIRFINAGNTLAYTRIGEVFFTEPIKC
ncbi:class I SAM-dependent methyltransferase [Paraflavitalea pollutisoli]|uniref:class I SAM-dependent methyltransferase n=1 Tax=Paraflavitalea pollutisoli TaxID=3034143 RepID=UPI0023EB3C94|nr:class I SAM-dependent methyltransferase [Paraflavitalea sp. H1-2-19X]